MTHWFEEEPTSWRIIVVVVLAMMLSAGATGLVILLNHCL